MTCCNFSLHNYLAVIKPLPPPPRTSFPPTLVRLSAPLGSRVLSESQWPSREAETGLRWWRFRRRQHSGPRSRILTDPIDQHPSALDTFSRLMNPGKLGSIFPEPRAAWRNHHSGSLVKVVFRRILEFGLLWWRLSIFTHITSLFQVVFQYSLKVQTFYFLQCKHSHNSFCVY